MGSQDLPIVSNLARCICTRGLANHSFIVFVINLLSFWFVCPRLLLLLLLLLVVLLTSSDHAAGNRVSSSGAGAIKWCCCQCITATGAGGAAGVGTDVVLYTAM